MSNADTKIGVVGVGRMGSNIARHLKDDGFTISAVFSDAPISSIASTKARALSLVASAFPKG